MKKHKIKNITSMYIILFVNINSRFLLLFQLPHSFNTHFEATEHKILCKFFTYAQVFQLCLRYLIYVMRNGTLAHNI